MVLPARQVRKVLREQLVPRAPRVLKARKVNPVLPDLKVLRVNKALPVPLVLKVPRVILVLPAWASHPSRVPRAVVSKRPTPSTIPMALPPPLW